MLHETQTIGIEKEGWLWRERVGGRGGEDKRPTRTKDHVLLDLIRDLSRPKK